MSQGIGQSPERNAKHRGSGRVSWWTCELCQMRWKRFPVDFNAGAGEPQGDERCAFEKRPGYMFKQINCTGDPCCQWCLNASETGEQL